MAGSTGDSRGDGIELAVSHQSEEGYVQLPFGKDQFKEFIQSLLGSPQAISRAIPGTFELDAASLVNLHQLLMQRIQQQNEAVLAKFEARIIYSDDSSVQLSRVEELATYNEIKPLASVAVHMTWDVLVKFQDKAAPEKQRIVFSAVATDASPERLDTFSLVFPPHHRVRVVRPSHLAYRIEHTARSWGADIEALLTNHINSLMKSVSPLKRFLIKNSGWIGFAVFALLLINVIGGGYLAYSRLVAGRAEQMKSYLAKTSAQDLPTLHTKVNFLLEGIATSRWQDPQSLIFYGFIGFLISVIVGAWAASSADNQPSSHLLLTRKSQERLADARRREASTWTSFGFSLIATIAIGVFSNYIFAKDIWCLKF